MYDQLPRIEAYREIQHRKVLSDLTPERAQELIFLVTEDQKESERAFANIKFASTPLE